MARPLADRIDVEGREFHAGFDAGEGHHTPSAEAAVKARRSGGGRQAATASAMQPRKKPMRAMIAGITP
ncbi:hypothetical protein GCM10011320_02640 [Neoroseomonas lacus]|uniref:Uncharacterized protein n=1 Tax=Neoroseomonas lacus TaxID=287609 RepID=A0A917K458_9PROT|nr:hypothetical protein GCM10011320_02640 [Neoroseomonas lacus]